MKTSSGILYGDSTEMHAAFNLSLITVNRLMRFSDLRTKPYTDVLERQFRVLRLVFHEQVKGHVRILINEAEIWSIDGSRAAPISNRSGQPTHCVLALGAGTLGLGPGLAPESRLGIVWRLVQWKMFETAPYNPICIRHYR